MITTDMCDEVQFATLSKNRVACHMREMGLRFKTTNRFVATNSKHDQPVASNILNRQFTVSAPNSVWVSDFEMEQTQSESTFCFRNLISVWQVTKNVSYLGENSYVRTGYK